MKKLRKFLTIGVMTLTVLGMTGIGSFANAAAPQAGDLIKMDGLSAVYFLGNDGKRYVFPSESVFFSWHNDFSGVVTISASELASYPLGANVVVRPGTKLVKITTDPSVYAVEANGVLRKISSEADAIAIFGANWAKRVIDVSDAFFTNYTIGTALAAGQIPAGTLVKNAGSGAVYLYDGTNYRSIANEAAFNANRFSFANVITISNTITASGNAITGAESLNYDAQVGGTGPVVTGSGLTASLSAATPAAMSVPQNGSRVPMAKVNLTAANDGAITVNSINVKRIGLSTYGNIDKVWAEKDGVIVASKKTMNSNDESVLVFSPALVVPAGQTVSLDFMASLKLDGTTAAANIGLSIAATSAISATSASISGSFPINGNLMSAVNYNVTEITMDNGYGSKSVSVGDENIQIGKFDVNFFANSRDIVLKSIMLKNTGTEDMSKVLMNVYLENNGKKVATGVISDKYITFTFTDGGLTMLKDDGDQTFAVKGDVIAKENSTGSTVVLVFNKIEDLNGYEKTNGFGVKMNTSAFTVSTLTINAGIVSVSKKSTSPSDSTVIKNSKNVVALLANVKADEAITADGLTIKVEQLTSTSSFENVKVYVNSVLLDSYNPTATGSTTLDSTLSLNKGDNEIKVTVDILSNATSTAKFQVSLNKSGAELLDTPEYALSGNSVLATDITGSATGAIITVGGASFSAIRSDGYSNKSVVRGTADISLGKFTVKATDDTVRITQIDIATTSAQTISAANFYDMKLFIDGSQVGSTRDYTSTGASFSSLSISVADNETKVIELKGSIDSSATTTEKVKVAMSFTAEDSRSKSVSITGSNPESVVFSVVDKGTLNITKDGDSPVSAILASKVNVEQTVAQFKLTATNDSANVTEIQISNATSTGATTTWDGTDSRIASYKLYVEGNTTAIDTVTPFQAKAKFVINNNAIVVPTDGTKKITIKAVLNNIDNDESATNAYLKVQVESVKFKSSNGDETPNTDLYVAANEFRIRKTVPTVALLALPNTTLTSGNSVVAKFTVTADSNADVKVSRIALDYTKTASVTLATTSNAIKVNGVAKAVTSTTSATQIFVDFGTSTPEIVAAGTSKTFEVILVTTVTGSNRESLSTSMVEAAYADGTQLTPAFNSLTWTDSASNTDANNYWFNSYRVNGLPSDTQTLSIN